MADEVFNSIGMGFLVPKNAPYTEAVSFKYVKRGSGLWLLLHLLLVTYDKIQVTSNFKTKYRSHQILREFLTKDKLLKQTQCATSGVPYTQRSCFSSIFTEYTLQSLECFSFYFFSIIKLQESGLIERWRAQRWSEGGSCESTSGPTNNAEALSLSSFTGNI